jgi:hypothetical protein
MLTSLKDEEPSRVLAVAVRFGPLLICAISRGL